MSNSILAKYVDDYIKHTKAGNKVRTKLGIVPSTEYFANLPLEMKRLLIDLIYETGIEEALEKETPEARIIAVLAQPDRLDKWRYLLSLVNESYDIGYTAEEIGLLAQCYGQLAVHERGSGNQAMAPTHKLRHNPAVHSLHVAGLIHSVFDQVMRGDTRYRLDRAELMELRRDLIRSAIVHDLGELRGELSVAEYRATMSARELEQFEAQRGGKERAIFASELNWHATLLDLKQRGVISKEQAYHTWNHHVHADHGLSYKAPQEGLVVEIVPNNSMERRWQHLLTDFDRTEYVDSFFGRAHKVAERCQSVQDYLRWEGVNGAQSYRAMEEKTPGMIAWNVDYVLSYATGKYNDAQYPSLEELAGTQEEKAVARLLDSLVKEAAADILSRSGAVVHVPTKYQHLFGGSLQPLTRE